MKLRFRNNSLRLRVNRHEVEGLACGAVLEEKVYFPGGATISYRLEPSRAQSAEASFCDGVIRVAAPPEQIANWANNDTIGLYFDLPVDGTTLRVAVEKDLECLDGPPEERDPAAFPRADARGNC